MVFVKEAIDSFTAGVDTDCAALIQLLILIAACTP